MPETQDRPLPQLAPGDFSLFEHVSTRYDALIAQGVEPEQLTNPAFWAHHSVRLKPMDEIRARAVDGTWMAELVVLDCSRTWAKVKMLRIERLTTSDVALTQASQAERQAFIDAHEVKLRGPHKWSVIRKQDRVVVQEDLATQDAAKTWLEALATNIGGAPAKLPSTPATATT
jgi:hypothetical protein